MASLPLRTEAVSFEKKAGGRGEAMVLAGSDVLLWLHVKMSFFARTYTFRLRRKIKVFTDKNVM